MQVKSMIIEHFKGYDSKVIDFGKRTFVKAKNGVGKSTIIAAHDWLWFDKDENLVSSPKVVPTKNDVPNYENPIKVTEILDIDGREVTVTKIQKNIVSKKVFVNGIPKITTSNSYEVNCIPKNEKEFKAYFEELGINFEQMLACSHIDVFLNQKQADMRKVLFSMAKGKSDLEICKNKKNLAQLHGLLEKGYKTDEVKAMYDKKLKDFNEELDSIDPKLSENQRQLVDIDTEGLQASKECVLKLITEGEQQLLQSDAQMSEYGKIQAEIMQVKLDMGGIENDANFELVERRRVIQRKIDDVLQKIYSTNRELEHVCYDLKDRKSRVEYSKVEYQKALDEYNRFKAQKFDESQLICSVCGQELPANKADEVRERFNKIRSSNMENFKARGITVSNDLKTLSSEIEELNKKRDELQTMLTNFRDEESKLNLDLESIPKTVNLADREDYNQLVIKLSTLQEKLATTPNNDELKASINKELAKNRETLTSIEIQLSKVDNNKAIKERIKALEDSKVTIAQQISDCEMILEQLKELSKEKNASLADEINSMFSKVSWKLFDYQKDGNYKEICIPALDGFTYDKMNGAKQVTAKIDIIAGLQKFYGINVPLFVDEMESVNDENVPRTEFQLVMMKVTEDRELRVEVEE